MPLQAVVRSASRAQSAAETATKLTQAVTECAAFCGSAKVVPTASSTGEIFPRLNALVDGAPARERHLRTLADRMILLLKVVGKGPLLGAQHVAAITATLDRISGPAEGQIVDMARVRRRRLAGKTRVQGCVDALDAACTEVEADNDRCVADLKLISARISEVLG